VAVRLDVEATRVHPPEQPIGGVDLGGIGALPARLLIGGGEHDLAVQPFERPTVGDETGGQVVEKLRMRWLLALGAEIAWCLDERFAKVPAPDAVDHDAGSERASVGEESFRQLQSS